MKPLALNYTDQKTNYSLDLPVTVFKKPTNEKEYNKLQLLLHTLIDQVRDNEKHPLVDVMQIIGENLEQYDDENDPFPLGQNISNVEMIKHLMTENQVRQKDLAHIFGGQGNVSKFLNGERPLSKKQIIGLKDYFSISADFFTEFKSKK